MAKQQRGQSKTNNRTGIAVAPDLAREMVEGTQEFKPSSSGNEQGIADLRIEYAKQAEPVGTLPAPSNEQQFQQAAGRAPNQQALAALMDKLGARLAFEGTGVRLYEALISKHQAFGGFSGGPSVKDLQKIRNEELEHFKMLREATEQLGGDPTAVTPAAGVQGTISMGIPQVLTDPRTNLIQGLEAILVAELADNASWEHLQMLARDAGETGLADRFGTAISNEQEHLQKVKGWLTGAAQELAAAA